MTANLAREAMMRRCPVISALQPRWRSGLSLVLLASVVLGGTLATAAGRAQEPLPGDPSGSSQPPGAVAAPAVAAPAAQTPGAAEQTRSTAPTSSALEERQRRLLMLLLMNSAGSLHPYGGLGR